MPTVLPVEPWHWWVAAAAFIAIEVFAPGVVFLWLGIAAAVVGFGLLAVPDAGFGMQLLAFALLSVLAVVVGRSYVRRHPIKTADPKLNRRGAELVGRVLVLVEPMTDGTGGRVRVGDGYWRAEGGGSLRVGTRVRVIGIAGASLVVEPVDGDP